MLYRLSPSSAFRLSVGDQLSPVARRLFFGPTVWQLAATLTGEATIQAFIGVRAVTLDGGALVSNSTTRSVVLLPVPEGAEDSCAVRCVVDDPANGTMLLLATSADGRTGYECGLFDDGGTIKSVIRRVIEGQLVDEDASGSTVNAVPQSAGDTPSSGNALNTPSLAAGPMSIEARFVNGRISLFIDDDTNPTLVHNVSAATYAPQADTSSFGPGTYGRLAVKYLGLAFRASGARATSANVYTLAGTRTNREEVVVAVAGGAVWASVGESSMQLVSGGVFAPSDDVRMIDFAGEVLMIGGGKARRFDPARRTVSPWTATDEDLPGYTNPGTTTATGIARHGTRVALFGVAADEQNLYESATSDADDWDTGKDLPSRGQAFTLSGSRPLKVGQPIIGAIETATGALLVGCTQSIHIITGDPALGTFDTLEVLAGVGVTGPHSICRLSELGGAMLHTTQGLMLHAGGIPAQLSRPILTDIVEDTPAGAKILCVEDARLGWAILFVTPESGPGVHLIRDARVAQWGGGGPGGGGFFPFTLPDAQQPTAAITWRGRALLGCRDGYLRWFDAAATTDDGQPINGSVMLAPIDPPDRAGGPVGPGAEVELTNVSAELDPDSGPVTLTVWGSATPMGVYQTKYRRPLVLHRQHPAGFERMPQPVRDAVLAVEVSGAAPWMIEQVWADLKTRRGSTRGCQH
jgi:hypothetical protein